MSSLSGKVDKALGAGEQNETNGKEPVSGEQGQGTAANPFDKGNDAQTQQDTVSNETKGQEPVSGQKGAGTAADPYDKGNDASGMQFLVERASTAF